LLIQDVEQTIDAVAGAPVNAGALEPALRSNVPGPRRLVPYFGCTNALLANPMKFWSRIANVYGGIARVPLKREHVYLVSDPELLYELLVTKRHKYRKNIRYRAAVKLFGEGLLLNEGDAWKRQRLASQPAFKAEHVARQVGWMSELVEAMLARWRGPAERGASIDVEAAFLRLAQTLSGRYLMGEPFMANTDRFCDAALAVKNAWPKPPRNLLQAWRRRGRNFSPALEATIRELDVCLYEYLAEQRRAGFADAGFAGMLVAAGRARGEELDDRSLRDQLLTLFYAGHETSAVSMCWTQYLLSQHPEAQRQLRREVADVLGTRVPTAADIDALGYTEQVINESLRLYSPIHSLSRVALEEDTIGGYAIPAGTTIYVSLYATHRLARLWPDPERFDPDRFTAERNAARPRFAFIPFAAGHRNCIGGTAAMTELKLVLALLTRRFELELAPGQLVEAAPGTTMHPRYGLRMRARPVAAPLPA
jgi:cytochrome P450